MTNQNADRITLAIDEGIASFRSHKIADNIRTSIGLGHYFTRPISFIILTMSIPFAIAVASWA